MGAYIAIFVSSAWLLYNSVADTYALPIIMLCPDGHFILRLLSSLALKWSAGFGVLGICVAVAGFLLHSKFDEKVSQLVYVLTVFYFIMSVFLIV